MTDNFFKSAREKLHKTQLQIAIALGCTPSAIAAWERGDSTPRLKNAARIAAVYGVSEKRLTDEIVARGKQAASPTRAA